MISRFQGEEGKKRLITALRAQQIVQDEEPLAVELADAVQLLQVEPGTPAGELIKQGGTDNEIYLIISGSVSIRINGREVATRSSGAHVGEMALIDPAARRNASIIATQPTVFGRITEPVFSAIAQRHPPKQNYQIRQVVGIDTSKLFVARTGIRGSNDLVWVGRAANYAAKLSSINEPGYSSYITDAVFQKLDKSAKLSKNGTGELMWESRSFQKLGITVHRSHWWWNPG